jgi:hypothetical protein
MPASIVERFWDEFPRLYVERFFSGLFDARRLAREECHNGGEFDSPEAENLEWSVRRAKIQTLAVAVATTVEGVTAVPSRGAGVISPWWHRRIQSKRAILTIHSASHPDEVLDPADYRQGYVESAHRQLDLFENEETQALVRPDDWTVYGMLLQGQGLEKPGGLGFAVIRFPLFGAVGYHAASIDLFRQFPHIVAEKQPNRGGGSTGGDDALDIDIREGEDIG